MDVAGQLCFFFVLMTIVVSSCLGLGVNMVQLYITPTTNVTCPAKPCLTLHQFATNVSWIKPSTTLIFLSGIHRLNSEVSISGISNLSMLSNLALEGYIACHQGAEFKFDNIDNLQIRGLKFVGCGNNRALSIKLFTVENSIFQGENDSETALMVNETNIIIKNSSFLSNTAGTCLWIFDVIGDILVCVGGAIFATHSNINITKSKLVGNSAEIGGAIYIHQNSNITINDSTFFGNQVKNVKFDTRCLPHWTENKAKFGPCSGGAIAMFQSRLIINGSTFSNNTSECANGGAGALSVQEDSHAAIDNSEFWNNNVNAFGGAVTIARRSTMIINNCTFHNNSASQGGVMYVMLSAVIVVNHSNFTNNSANLSGGAITTDQSSQLNISGSQFIRNKASTGGALSAARSKVNFTDSILSNNKATESGGAVYILQSDIVFGVGPHGYCILAGNFAINGGGVYAIESTLYMHGKLTIMSNMASDTGGGLYLYHSNLIGYYSSNIVISGNKANNKGGGIHAINSLITAYCTCRKTKSQEGSIHFIENVAQKRGGICLESAAQIRVQKNWRSLPK